MVARIIAGIVMLLKLSMAGQGQETVGVRINGLAAEDSNYLRSQAKSAIEWRSWGPEARAEARRTGRPMFVSIGYHSCLWTSRMDREAFADPATVKLLNDGAVNIKLDRFERPDLDRLYMRFVEATGQRSGWPLNLWVDADGVPMRATVALTATDEGQGSIALEISHFLKMWSTDGPHLQAQARIDLHDLATRTGPGLAGPIEIHEELIGPVQAQILGQFDPVHGGFGRVPKFPSPARLAFLGQRAARDAGGLRGESLAVIKTTLETMARGGLHDQLGGGFFRYALDEAWRRPYFEKLALDQALLTDAYLLGHRLTGQPEFAAVARQTLGYVVRELGHPEGGFYNAEHCESQLDTASEPREGAYYVWSRDELRREAGAAADVMEMVFDIRDRGNVPPGCDPFHTLGGANLLSQKLPMNVAARRLGLPVAEMEAVFTRGCVSLLAARQRRPRPSLDRLLVTQMNAALISSLSRASLQLNEPAFLDHARRAAEVVQAGLWDASSATLFRCRLDRAPRHLAAAEDHAYLVRALIDLHETTGEIRWLRWAVDIQTAFDRHHADQAGGGYFDARHDCVDVPVALKSIDDASAISPNAIAGMNLVRWSVLLQHPDRGVQAHRLLEAFAAPLRAGSASVAGLVQVADALARPPRRVILFGSPRNPSVQAARTLLASAPPGRWSVLSVEDVAARDWLVEHQALPAAVARQPFGSQPVFYQATGADVENGPRPLTELHKSLGGPR